MKKTFQLVAVSLITFAVTIAHAQSRITVNVPFNFAAAEKTFPAGVYSVSVSRDILTLQDSSGKTVFLGTANEVSGRHVGNVGQVVFHCYSDRCFLSEVWTSARDTGSQLLPTRIERELVKQRERTEFALLDPPKKR